MPASPNSRTIALLIVRSQRSRAFPRQPHHLCVQDRRRGARFPPGRRRAGGRWVMSGRAACRTAATTRFWSRRFGPTGRWRSCRIMIPARRGQCWPRSGAGSSRASRRSRMRACAGGAGKCGIAAIPAFDREWRRIGSCRPFSSPIPEVETQALSRGQRLLAASPQPIQRRPAPHAMMRFRGIT